VERTTKPHRYIFIIPIGFYQSVVDLPVGCFIAAIDYYIRSFMVNYVYL